MKTNVSHPLLGMRDKRVARPWWVAPAACLATVLALPVNAGIVVPTEPLTTGARVPPNVLFVLDNSGSMSETRLPDSIPNVSTINIKNQTFIRNKIYYNPYKVYLPWVDSTGATMNGGRNYNDAYSGTDRIPPFDNSTTDLQTSTQSYYVPKDPVDTAAHGNVSGYYRYQILTSGAVQRSEWDASRSEAVVAPGYPVGGLSGTGTTTMYPLPIVTLPANVVNMVVVATGAGNAKLYIRQNAAPDTVTFTDSRVTSSATKTITRNNPGAGDWHIGLSERVPGGFSGVTVTVTYQVNSDGCTGGGWVNCTNATPTGRSDADERTNFATWYSYHRSRYKVAKAGAGRAFAELGSNYRLGYRNIWNNMPITGSAGGVNWATHPITRAKPIPVTRNGGLFDDPNGVAGADNNRSAWYQRLYAETGSSATPLRKALWDAGNYFASDTTADGPWGPGDVKDQYICRQSFTILTTDGYRNDDSSNSPTYDYTGAGKTVGEQDDAAGSLITSPTGETYTYSPQRPFRAPQANTLADIAMYFWKTDLRTDLDNKVPKSADDPAFWQHMTTFSVSIGAEGTLNPATDLPAITSGGLNWPVSENLQPNSIDDLWHAAVNGHGSFVLANDPDAFTQALRDALASITERTSSYSNVASNSVSLDTDSQVFNASYVSGAWTGSLSARDVSASGVSSTVSWNATIGSSRTIITSDGTTGAVFPTSDQLIALARGGGVSNYPVTGTENADYIKGDQTKEGGYAPRLRERVSLLGDIIGSSPAYVEDTNTIYVGANDGMLHAFNAKDGKEVFAYIPNIINWGWLSTLSRGDYAHRYFVDGPIVVSNKTLTPGKNVLVGTLGRGGKGLYSLDVTNPGSFGAGNVKWERAETPDSNMGLVVGKPIIAKVRNGTPKPAVVIGNGVNSANERAVLIVMDLETGAVIREIDTGAGSATLPNALSTPTGVYSIDGKTLAYVYAGDLLGNVWKFDLTSNTPGAWSVSKLFTATNAGGDAQPITSGIAVALEPSTNKRWIFFGTGRYMTVEDADPANNTSQSMYGFVDDGSTITRAGLAERKIEVTGEAVSGFQVRGFQKKEALPSGAKGWFIDLPGAGERIVQDAQVVSTFLLTASMMPAGEACEADGSGFINALDAFTGTSAGGSYFDLDGDGQSANDQTSDGRPVGSINIEVGMPTLPNLLRGLIVVGGTGGGGVRSATTLRPQFDRVSWREIRVD